MFGNYRFGKKSSTTNECPSKMDQIDQNSNDHHDGDDHVEAKHVYVLLTDRLVTVIIIVFLFCLTVFLPLPDQI